MKIVLYSHGGSDNHGCEAIVRGTYDVLKSVYPDSDIILNSDNAETDRKYGLENLVIINSAKEHTKKLNIDFLRAYLKMKIKKDFLLLDLLPYQNNVKKYGESHVDIAISIGGDNYCYSGNEFYAGLNKMYTENGMKTVLWGCSIEPDILEDKKIITDLRRYFLIVARESITYNALANHGLKNTTVLCPDPAFQLKCKKVPLPEGFEEGNTIGINISPLIMRYEKTDNMVLKNYINLLQYIMKNTSYKISLIPHVVKEKNDDREAIRAICDVVQSDRIVLVQDYNCEELKYIISKCIMFVGARTHATIAAYSTCVPTLVVGYSVKAKGIAKDLFGTYENYVVPVQKIKEADVLVEKFQWLSKNRENIHQQLLMKMPKYINSGMKAGKILKSRIEKISCCGCTACANICDERAIQMVEDDRGFLYPVVNEKKCLKCGQCEIVCPFKKIGISVKNRIKVYSCRNRNASIRQLSSSGGVFWELAKNVIERGGIVVGAVLDENNIVKHICATNLEQAMRMCGSKYSQSLLENVYSEVKKFLQEEKEVLFSGTPCQIAGLKRYLNFDYEKLICVDIVCHGVPSPKILSAYLTDVEHINETSVEQFVFRDKRRSWKDYDVSIHLADGREIVQAAHENIFLKGYIQNLYIRPSCTACKYKNYNSGSDIMIGDFWGVQEILPEWNDDKGTSVLFLKTHKGVELFCGIKEHFEYQMISLSQANIFNECIEKSVQNHNKCDDFFAEMKEQVSFVDAVKKYL